MPMWLVDSLVILVLVCKENEFITFMMTACFVICTDSTAYSSAHFGQNGAVIIALDDVACTVYESRLVDCPYDSNVADCTHSEDAGVQCVPRTLHSHRYILPNICSHLLSIVQCVLMAISD